MRELARKIISCRKFKEPARDLKYIAFNMKSTTVVCAFVVLACLCLQANATCPVEGEDLSVGVHYRNCMKITCNKDGSIAGLGCAESRCLPGKQIGYQETDMSKPYPDCCARPICA